MFILITFAVYVNFSNYTLWWPVGSVPNSKDVMKWLDEPGSLSKCLGLADQIIDEIHDAMYQSEEIFVKFVWQRKLGAFQMKQLKGTYRLNDFGNKYTYTGKFIVDGIYEYYFNF